MCSSDLDAIVVVVSEETGSISYAYKSQFVRGLSVEELRAFLTSLLVKGSRRSQAEASAAALGVVGTGEDGADEIEPSAASRGTGGGK